ncbi:MAG: hypothetical protein V4466_03985 [Pseudomonadota bacterium]
MTPRALALLLLLSAAGPALAQPDLPPSEAPQSTAQPTPPPTELLSPPLPVETPFERPEEQVFISPAGEPFRAPIAQPYPVAAWFARADADKDGVITQAEFVADSLAFFDVLDTDKDGKVDGFESSDYEKDVAPEISGVMRRPDAGRGSGGRGGWNPFSRADAMWGRGPTAQIGGGRGPVSRRQGAAQYGLLNEPHPVRGADADLDSRVSRSEADAAARRRYQLLDTVGGGRLSLADLPLTPAQRAFQPPPDKR